jgi:hypothetical protein
VEASLILAIDPGQSESGWVRFDSGRVIASGVLPNEAMLDSIKNGHDEKLAIEMVASYGMPVGKEVFETVLWIGRMVQAWRNPDAVRLIYRKDVKLHLCGSPRAKDANIRQALIDLLGPPGIKARKGATYGVKSHAWAALAVAVTAERA